MAKFRKIDYNQFKQLQEKLKKFDKLDANKICENTAKELGQSLYKKVKKKTPVKTGNLKDNWQAKAQAISNGYQVDIYNSVEYAPYVEFGHRTLTHNGVKWTPGRHMLTESEIEVEKNLIKSLTRILKNRLEDFLMINKIIDAISIKLFEIFGENYTIYKEDIKQNLHKPCFFIDVVNSDMNQIVANRYYLNNYFDICYFSCKDENKNEMLNVIDSLFTNLEYITLENGDLLRGLNMNFEIVDYVLHFFVQYNLIVKKI